MYHADSRRWCSSTASAAPPPPLAPSSPANTEGLHNSDGDVAALRAARDGFLASRLHAARVELAALEDIKKQCDVAAQRLPDRRMRQLFVFLLFQAGVLFDWTYVHFDWNLVEPITYLVGYSVTWIAILWYGALQREFSYDTWRSMLQKRERERLYAQHRFDLRHYEQLRVEVVRLERVLRSLEPL